MSICDGCMHNKVCGAEGAFDEGLTYCQDFLGWISVSKKLPKENKIVMASTEYGVYPEARYSEDGWECIFDAGADYWVTLFDVKAWMPIPKRYEEESEVDK